MPVAIDPSLGLEVATDAVARATKAGADGASVNHTYREVFEVNFDTNDITLVRTTVADTLTINVFDGTKKGTAQLTGRAHDAVEGAVAHALEAARAGEQDAANVLPPPGVEPARDSGESEPPREAMVDAVLKFIKQTATDYPSLRSDRSYYTFTSDWSSYANSLERVQHARTGWYNAVVVISGKDEKKATSFNYVSQLGTSAFDDLASIPLFRRLMESTMASFDARSVPSTFVGDVIFTPESLGTLVGAITGGLNGIALMRKTTPYLERLGSTIAAPSFSLLHRPGSMAAPDPFDGDGFVNHDLDVIVNGVLQNFLVDWYFCQKLDRPMTTGLSNFVIPAGDVALDDIIASTERGIVLGRYSGGTPNQNLDFSGVAKNSFYVENGKIVHPISETMIAGNFASALESITAVSRETIDSGYSVYPWVRTGGITISTK